MRMYLEGGLSDEFRMIEGVLKTECFYLNLVSDVA